MTTRLNIYNEKNVCLGYVSYTFIDSDVIHFDDLRIDKQRLTDTIRVEGEDGLWFLDTDFSNYYESGNFCVFDYGNINLTKKPEFVWVLLEFISCEGEILHGMFKTFKDGKVVFDSFVEEKISKYQDAFNKQNESRLYLSGPKEDKFGNWEFVYRISSGLVGCSSITLKKYMVR